MEFPDKLTDEEFRIRCKEWKLVGYEIVKREDGSILIGKRGSECGDEPGRVAGWLSYHAYRKDPEGFGDEDWHLMEHLLDWMHGIETVNRSGWWSSRMS